jgi:hypothetical protein
MPKFSIDLDWQIDAKGYSLFENGKWGWSIVRNGGKLETKRPFEKIDNHFKLFAAVRTREDLLKFVNTHGLLEDSDPYGSSVMRFNDKTGKLDPNPVGEIEGEKVDGSLEQAKFFRAILLAKESGRNVPRSIGLAVAEEVTAEAVGEIYLARDNRRGVKFVFRATSLMNGIWIQLTQSILGDVKIRSCEFCGAFFDVGVGTDRRAGARFCSKLHQIEFNSRKRSKAP